MAQGTAGEVKEAHTASGSVVEEVFAVLEFSAKGQVKVPLIAVLGRPFHLRHAQPLVNCVLTAGQWGWSGRVVIPHAGGQVLSCFRTPFWQWWSGAGDLSEARRSGLALEEEI